MLLFPQLKVIGKFLMPFELTTMKAIIWIKISCDGVASSVVARCDYVEAALSFVVPVDDYGLVSILPKDKLPARTRSLKDESASFGVRLEDFHLDWLDVPENRLSMKVFRRKKIQ